MLLRLHDLVLDRQDEIIDLIVLESGKARKHAFDEPLHIALTARYYARTAHRAPRHRAQARRRARPDAGRGQPRAQGRRRHHLAVELPVHDGAVRRAPRPAGRQRGGHQARRPDDAHGPARRPAARRGRLPRGPVAGRGRAGSRDRHADDRALRLHLLHRLDGHRPADRRAVRRAPDRLLARARRQEPDPDPARRRPREGRRGRGARVVLQRRPAVRLHRADVRRRPGLRPVRRALRRPHRGDDARAPAWSGASTWAPSSPRPSSTPCRRTSTTRSPRAPACWPAAGPGPTSVPTSSSRPSSRASRPT